MSFYRPGQVVPLAHDVANDWTYPALPFFLCDVPGETVPTISDATKAIAAADRLVIMKIEEL